MNPASVFAFTCPAKFNSGNKALEHLPAELAGFNSVKPLVVTSEKTVGRKALRTLISSLGDSGMTLGVFDGVTDTADRALIENLKKTCLEKEYDAIVALGGGKVADVAKVLNLAVSLKLPDARRLSTETPVSGRPGRLRPLVLIPTAEADGLETSGSAHLEGMVFSSMNLAPGLVVIDPRLTRTTNAKALAAAGLAALGRAVEAHIDPGSNPFRDAYSFTAIRFIMENLPGAVKKPGDTKACLAIANAAAMSGCAFSNTGAGAIRLHKLGRVMQEMYDVHPGFVMAMCLPHVLGDCLNNGGHNLAALFHPLVGDEAFAHTPPEQRAGEVLSLIARLLAGLQAALGDDMPRTLKEAGIPLYMMEDILDVLDDDSDGAYLRSVAERIWDKASPAGKKG